MLFFRRSPKNYIPLSRLSEPESIDDASTPNGTRKGRIIDWATTLILICGFVDAAALADLPFRSSYAGLEELYAKWEGKRPQYHPITNLPNLVTQADTSSRPRKTIVREAEYVRTSHGMILIDNRHFLVRPRVSTIVQFRILDFGMERCDLMITFPKVSGGESGTYFAADIVEMDVWELQTDKLVAGKTKTEIRAPRIALLDSIRATYGSNISMPFECKSGFLHTFEFTSNGEAQTKASGRELIGPYVIQYQTV
ncbi:hypothetical protein BDZ89DRAFT_1144196 [Hymenopellis radicata]|nr:hypothetical protein BDZ89DRAFT_1144196 [Hymenopellis radicata]